jgi:carboxylesterase type B
MSLLLPFEGATHCLELPYFLGKNILGEFVHDEQDEAMMDKFSTYLIEFIKTGNPNNDKYAEKWEPFTIDHHDKYFLFDIHEYGMRDKYAEGRLEKWDKIFAENPKPNGFSC